MMEHILVRLAKRYPQLLLPLSSETKNSFLYKRAVLRGIPVKGKLDFSFSPEDRLVVFNTPAGRVEVLYLSVREDFEHCIQALAYRCDPRPVPKSMGASTVYGLINWEKIHRHREVYEAAGGNDWNQEFKEFTAEKSNYLDTLIISSKGFYSAVDASAVGCSPESWMDLSRIIRTYHELTHFVCRSIYPNNIDAIRDEVVADMMGIIAAMGIYDVQLASLFLGIEKEEYRFGGRLENYIQEDDSLNHAILRAKHFIRVCDQLGESYAGEPVFDFMMRILPSLLSVEV